MLYHYTNYLAPLPNIVVYMNCDTRLAINVGMFELGMYDEFIFVIKNYDYIDSSYVFLFRATKKDIDKNGEVLFKIDPDISKNIKPGAFYNCAVLIDALNPNAQTEYKKLTENGKITIEYGAHDLALPAPEEPPSPFAEILGSRLELTDDTDSDSFVSSAILGIRVEDYSDSKEA